MKSGLWLCGLLCRWKSRGSHGWWDTFELTQLGSGRAWLRVMTCITGSLRLCQFFSSLWFSQHWCVWVQSWRARNPCRYVSRVDGGWPRAATWIVWKATQKSQESARGLFTGGEAGCLFLWGQCSRHVKSSRGKNQTHVPCIGKRTLNHWTTREVLSWFWQLTCFPPTLCLGN